MITALQAASYISSRYYQEYGDSIDEMKLHKLLYFAQREAIVVNNEPMFAEQFVAWKYGPVMLCVRDAYKYGQLKDALSDTEKEQLAPVFDSVFKRYAGKTSWSLSTLTHGEYSWQNARKGLSSDTNGYNMISVDDIRKDAERIKLRRILFEQFTNAMSTSITTKQKSVLDSLICERLSSDTDNKVLIKGIVNTRNSNLVNFLQSDRAWQEDEGNITAYYLVKSQSGKILAFFALRCGEIFQNVNEDLIKEAKDFRQNIETLKDPSIDDEEKDKIAKLVASAILRGWTEKLADVYIRKSIRKNNDANLDKNKDNHHVAKAFSAVELTLFCNNEADGIKEEWKSFGLHHRMGSAIFWHLIIPKIKALVNLVGCEYLYLFAADREADGTLVNYYKTRLQFETPVKLGANKPSFDYGCFFLCQRVNVLLRHQTEFYDNFNENIAGAV